MIEILEKLTQIKPARNFRNLDSINESASYLVTPEKLKKHLYLGTL